MTHVMPYPRDLRERAVRLVLETEDQYPTRTRAMRSIAAKLGIGSVESLRNWVRQAEVDAGQRPGTTTEESDEVKRLKREVAELRRANEILKAAASFFAAELDRPHPRS
jgi:transposase